MRKAALLLGVLPGLWAATGTGCSPASGSGAGDGVGNGGESASGGSGGIPTGGAAGTANGGTGNIVTTGGGGSGGGEPPCDELVVTSRELMPTVMILVDNSSSMYEPREQLWDALYTALMAPTGPVKAYEGRVRFGFASYRGVDGTSVPETDDSCAQIETVGSVSPATVAPALNNHSAIDAVYQALGVQGRDPNNAQWETPTGHAIRRIASQLAAFTADPPGPKYLLLVTDGNPNTCMVGDPQCGSDQSIKAVQDAFASGIGTLALGIGDIIAGNTGCEPANGRCGPNHLQDLANAGVGAPVEPPPMNYWYQQCAVQASAGMSPGMPFATYAATGMGGTTPYFTAANPAEIAERLAAALTGVISCTLDMDAIVTGNPALGTVTITPDGGAERPLTINDTGDGWVLESNNYQVTLTGQACTDYKAGRATVNIEFPCRVAEPR